MLVSSVPSTRARQLTTACNKGGRTPRMVSQVSTVTTGRFTSPGLPSPFLQGL